VRGAQKYCTEVADRIRKGRKLNVPSSRFWEFVGSKVVARAIKSVPKEARNTKLADLLVEQSKRDPDLVDALEASIETMIPALANLYRAHAAKFDEICASLAVAYGENTNPANLSDAHSDEIVEEAKRLIENWDMATVDNQNLEAKTKLQHLLAEHHELGERILDRQHEIYWRDRVEDGEY
jgi:hypothetical protein